MQVKGETATGIQYSATKESTEGWHSGTIELDALAPQILEKTKTCQNGLAIEIRGALFDYKIKRTKRRVVYW
jgi:hypothetical protein